MKKSFPITRRDLIFGGVSLATTGSTLLTTLDADGAEPQKFSFVHITDTHIQPELGAAEGVKKAFDAIRALKEKPAFALIGGDIVMDVALVDRPRSDLLYDLWNKAAAELSLPLYYTVGNHDVYAIGGKTPVAADDPEFGKGMWQKRTGVKNRYDTFDFGGWRFVTLDSVGVAAGGKWWGEIDPEQIRWLDDLLRKTGKEQPVVFLTHIPVLTMFGLYTEGTTQALTEQTIVRNGKEFAELIRPYNVKAVFQGHTHVVEACDYLGTRYITGGAVCGEWWKGPRLGVHPEGFTVATVDGKTISHRYVPYGWQARLEKA
ncbi:MAG: metallophosphoesterase [Fibrella sp.]|nr:metallophosphoesterase [Armatimonadota bacterium]